MAPSVFLGLVTHDASSFPHARSQQGLLAETESVLQERGIRVRSEIHSANHFSELGLRISASDVWASINATLSTQAAWHRYLDPERNHVFTSLRLAAWRFYRTFDEVVRRSKTQGPRGRTSVERLINIELAHIHLMKDAIRSESDWTLILEDDATSPNAHSFAHEFASFLLKDDGSRSPAYLNMSRSFEAHELRISHLLTYVGQWNADVSILQSSQPVTNTVCAIAYHRDFLIHLMNTLEDIPIEPVLPIDWKINLALMKMFNSHMSKTDRYWTLHPAPIIQGSMH